MAMGVNQSAEARHNVITLESKQPQSDAEMIMFLFPEKFVLESRDSDASAAVLVEQTDDLQSTGGLILFIVFREYTLTVSETFMPSGMLVVKDDDIRDVVARCKSRDASLVRFASSFSLSSVELFCAAIRLNGGADLLLVTGDILATAEGRLAVASMFANPDLAVETEGKKGIETFIDTDSVNPALDGRSTKPGKSTTEDSIPPKFPSLAVTITQKDGQKMDFPLNSRVGVPVETDLFVGKLLIVLRPPDPTDDSYYNEKIFSKKKRRLICQLQGKFKYVPKGTVYAGGEVSDQMKLGLVGKGMCSVLLNLVRSFNSDLNYSFGDSKGVEAARIVFPAWQFFDDVIVTKSGETPPPINEIFQETKSSKAARKAGRSEGNWNVNDTYSFAFYSMYLDIPDWRVVNLPVTKDLDLRTFWGSSFLSIVMYEKPVSKEERHVRNENKYIFDLQMKFLGHHVMHDEGEESESETEDILPWGKARPLARSATSFGQLSTLDRQESGADFTDRGESDSDLTRFFDTNEAGDASLGVEDDELFYFDSVQTTAKDSTPETLSMVDLDFFCPAWVEIFSSSKGKYITTYAFNLHQGSETVFRTVSQFENIFNADIEKKAVGAFCSPRMSSLERGRRIMGQMIADSSIQNSLGVTGEANRFKKLRTDMDSLFLKKPVSPANTSRPVLASGYCARALSEHHWIEEWVQLTDRHLSFYQPTKNKPNFRMSLKSIVNVARLATEECPCFPRYSFLAIETIGRTIYLMFAGESERNQLMSQILKVKSSNSNNKARRGKSAATKETEEKRSVNSDILFSVDDPTEEYLHKSSLWSCKQRRILNCRKFSFTAACKGLSAAAVVEDALVRALDPKVDSQAHKLVAFLNSTARLKEVDVNVLNEREKLAFFLNLYHVMIMHAFLALGTPDSAFKWLNYFNMVAYQCSDDIFSLTELEHNIIRGSMNYPSQFISKFVLPKSQFRFALTQADYRINFALNCGSRSNPASVPIYKAAYLEEQLNQASASYLQGSVQVSTRSNGFGVSVLLPKICQWFAQDFGDGSSLGIVRMIVKFLCEKDQKALLKPLCSENPEKPRLPLVGDISVKFSSYSFECRNLKLADFSARPER